MNVKVVLDGHSTNASEMQHNGMEGIKKVSWHPQLFP